MIRCPQCGMDNNDGTPNCWKCGYPLDNIKAKKESDFKKEVEEEVIEEKRILDDKKRATSDSSSKKIALIPIFAVILLLIRANTSGINLLGLFSGKGLHENFSIICLSILFVGLLICVCLMGLIPLMRLGINEISKKKSITPLKKVILILHFNKMNNELQTPNSSFYFWRILSVCLWSNQKKSSNYNKKKFIYYYHLTKDFK